MQKSVLIGFVGALIIVLAVSLKVSAEPVWSADVLAQVSSAQVSSAQISEPVQQTVDRSHKGDRTSASARSRNAAHAKLSTSTTPAPSLIEGCEPVVSGILASPLAQVAGSCQT